jgi:hypothetical protein
MDHTLNINTLFTQPVCVSCNLQNKQPYLRKRFKRFVVIETWCAFCEVGLNIIHLI